MVVTWNEFSCLSLDFLQDKGVLNHACKGFIIESNMSAETLIKDSTKKLSRVAR